MAKIVARSRRASGELEDLDDINSPEDDEWAASVRAGLHEAVNKGEGSGHPFRGNQWSKNAGQAKDVQRVKLTKTVLGNFIQWTSSRYNMMSKKEAVELAYQLLTNTLPEWRVKSGQYKNTVLSAGAFTEHSTMGGMDYLVDVQNKSVSKGYANGVGDVDFKPESTIYFE